MTPEDITVLTGCVLLAATLIYMIPVFRRDLMMLQQNSYRNERYTRWANQNSDGTAIFRLFTFVAIGLILVHTIPFRVGAPVSTLIVAGCTIYLARRRYKKPLVMTRRAWRIYGVMSVLSYGILAATWLLSHDLCATCAAALLECVASPFIVLTSNFLLKPVEAHINRRYYNEARDILASMPDLKIIGITGSYGKTSTKHYLQRILSEKYDTLMTPGSFNTTMGVIRTIREYLKPYNEVFIVEMGAKQPGDIGEICDLVHPSIGIVTAVGEQHLESFKSIENVQRTKFELVDALPAGGLAVVNDDFPFVANRKVSNIKVIRYAVTNTAGADYRVTEVEYSPVGSHFTIEGPGGMHLELRTGLVGECNISNLTAAVIVALHLGVDHSKIRYAVENIAQVEHRLNIKRTPGGITIIDDAFNSNPDGSRMAVDVLSRFTGGKRIIVTPGMIELGERGAELNRTLGRHISKGADVAIIVGAYNREALVDGILEEGVMKSDNIHTVDTFALGQQLLATIVRPGDTVLYENDLPDTFK